MTRQIKFRAWDKKYKAWIKGFAIWTNGVISDDGEKVFMQYTGLKDKNGKEIYEGDIVKVLQTDWASKDMNDTQTLEEYLDSKTEKYVVKFIAPNFHMLHEGVEDHLHYLSWGQHGYCEIIGNIYENPELLK